jgi:hypothetical protein
MSDIYRGYAIKPVAGGFVWTDEQGNDRHDGAAPYKSADAVMDGIDRHKRAMRNAAA